MRVSNDIREKPKRDKTCVAATANESLCEGTRNLLCTLFLSYSLSLSPSFNRFIITYLTRKASNWTIERMTK